MSLVSWVNANMYFNSSCEVNASDNGFDVTTLKFIGNNSAVILY